MGRIGFMGAKGQRGDMGVPGFRGTPGIPGLPGIQFNLKLAKGFENMYPNCLLSATTSKISHKINLTTQVECLLAQDSRVPSARRASTGATARAAATGCPASPGRWGRGGRTGSTGSWGRRGSPGRAGSTPQASRAREGRMAIPEIGYVRVCSWLGLDTGYHTSK